MRRQRRLTRRGVLRGIGGVLVGLPFLEALDSPAAAQSSAPPPRRLILWSWPNGMVMDRWVTSGQDDTFRLSPILLPLEKFKRCLLPIHGLRLGSALAPENAAVGHARGASALFTNSRLAVPDSQQGAVADRTLHPSLDAALAAHSDFPTRLSAVRLQVKDTAGPSLFFDTQGRPLRPNPNPWDVHRVLFTDARSPPDEYRALLARRHTVLDAVMDDYRALRGRLGTQDQQRLEHHLEAIRSVDRRLEFATSACDLPALGAERDPIYLRRDENIPALGRLQTDLLVAALACDATRLAALQWLAPGADASYSWLGISRPHHALTHEAREQADVQLTQIYSWYSEQLAYLLSSLQGVVEEDGSTLLDNVILCASSEISVGWNHSVEDCAFLLVGGEAGPLRGGRALSATGQDHGRLLVTLAASFGSANESFGDPRYCRGGTLDGVLDG